MAVGLNIVVGYAGLLDLGYVAFYAAGAYIAAWFASLQFDQVTFHFGSVGISDELPGHPHLDLARAADRRPLHAARRHHHRAADPAPARRLPRDRDARLRRDRPAGRAQRRTTSSASTSRMARSASARSTRPASAASASRSACRSATSSRSSRAQSSSVRRSRCSLITVFCSVRLRDSRLGRAWVAIREDETAAAAMGVPLMRTKTWAVRDRRVLRWRRRRLLRELQERSVPEPTSTSTSRSSCSAWSSSAAWAASGARCVGGMILGYLNVEGLATIGSKANECRDPIRPRRSTSSGSTALIIVVMMLFRPDRPDHRAPPQAGDRARVHDTPFYDVRTRAPTPTATRPMTDLSARRGRPQGVRRPRRGQRHRLHDPAAARS